MCFHLRGACSNTMWTIMAGIRTQCARVIVAEVCSSGEDLRVSVDIELGAALGLN